jgi:predicted alpha-1,2-mannosidase
MPDLSRLLPLLLLATLPLLPWACSSGPAPSSGVAPESRAEAADLARWVDPFIGTGGHGHTFPGATVPFGLVQLSPDTRLEGWDGCSGYHFSDEAVHGFSHTHLSGTGCSDYGDVLVVPRAGDEASPIPFDKAKESASPGDYRVHLDNGVDVELTSTARVGLHRYRFPAGTAPRITIDLRHRDRLIAAHFEVDANGRTTIRGERRSSNWARDQRLFFSLHFSRPFERWSGDEHRGEAVFAPSDEPLLVKVSLSATGIEGAERNLQAELPGWDFDGVRRRARELWNEALAKVEVEGGTERERRIFYTALYHCFLAPNVWSDVDGRYRGLDGEVHEPRGHNVYTVFSLWDTFRTAHPLYSILEQERTRAFLGTFLAHFEEGGRLPVWELAANETDCMIGYHAVPVILDAWAAGLLDADDELAKKLYEASVHSAMLDQRGQDAYKQLGFIPSGHDDSWVSKTL